tara:strand:- start:31 stop:297 length:267 start_codon:yes stop_codon:yes gene_type:complete
MIELLKYLANNLQPEQLLEVAHIISKNPEMIDTETFMQIINEVDGMEILPITNESEYEDLVKRMQDIDEMRAKSEMYKILKDNNISLN